MGDDVPTSEPEPSREGAGPREYRRQELMVKVCLLASSCRDLLVEMWEDFQRHW